MTRELLAQANALNESVGIADSERSEISKLYCKRERLTSVELDRLFEIANRNTGYMLEHFILKFKEL